ncbi:MAG TPA: hypothetical protein VE953_02800 [Terriglobales bacterium]|nr:hypothetical protein [Terriglobales bacterium]
MVAIYTSAVADSGRAPLFWLFLCLLLTFLVTRIVTRRIRAGSTGLKNWNVGGVHVHHQVFGIIAMLIAGGLEFAYRPGSPWSEILGGIFGAGVALTLDEFALWLYVDDVYWTEAGRRSLDAVFVALVVTGLLLVGFVPVQPSGPGSAVSIWLALTIVLVLVPSAIAAIKGKPIAAIVGLFIWVVAIAGAVRLAKPTSPWAHRRYRSGSAKLARAEARFGPAYEARWNRVRDLVGGAPNRPSSR